MPPQNDLVIKGEGGKDWCPLQNEGCKAIKDQVDKMQQIERTIQENRDSNVRIEQKLDHGNREFKELNRYLKGNGQPGLLDRVTRVETKYALLWVLSVGAVAAALGALVTELIKG